MLCIGVNKIKIKFDTSQLCCGVSNLNVGFSVEQIEEFINYLGKKKEEWQIKQARHALQIYNYYRTHTLGNSEHYSSDSWQSFFQEMRNILRLKQRSFRTEKTYMHWLKRFGAFCLWKPAGKLNSQDLKNFLSHLAVDRKVGSATQNQAFNSLLFFYRHVLSQDIGNMADTVRAKRKKRLSVVLSL